MQNEPLPLTAYSSEQRQAAMIKYQVIAPYLRSEKNLIAIVEETGIAKRTLRYWIRNYEKFGLKGLIRKTRSDSGKIQLDSEVIVTIEQMILKHRKNSLTSIHRMICEHCQQQSWKQPSYYQVYKIAQSLSQSLKNLAHDGQKAYENQYDLIHRREASYPNEIWQADHTLLDILVLNEKGKPERPWLTIILDDYSRAVAGYFLTFQAPSATQTALTLHQGIWHKQNSDWIICGIPEQFYTDHGSDFTSNHLEQVAYKKANEIGLNADEKILETRSIFYTAPAVRATKMTDDIYTIGTRINLVRTMYKMINRGEEEYTTNAYEGIDLIIVDEIDRLKLQNLEQLRDIYDRNDLAMILIGMPGIEKRLARYPQLYSRIGFAHEFDKLSKDETHHILEYKWKELGLSIKLEDFSDYEAITSIIKITGGNFRLIQRLFTQIERILEINHLNTISTEVVEAARDSLVIGIK